MPGLSLEEVAFLACRGGWPGAIGKKGNTALGYAREYVESVAESDLTRADGVPREPERVRRIMRSLARLQTTQSSIPAIRKDMAANDVSSLSETTIASYLNALEKIFVVENAHAWSPSLRAKSSVRTSDTRYFADPSLATAAIGVTPGNLMDDLRTFGLFFETMAVRDLRVYSGAMGGTVSHYHDKTGLECDAVVHAPNGDYGLVEIKLGGEALIEQGTKSLGKLAALLRRKGGRQPSFIMIVTAVGDFAYRRKDGVLVCPLSALRP